MGKKKNKIAKLTEEEYYAYISGLKNDTASVGVLVPPPLGIDDGNDN